MAVYSLPVAGITQERAWIRMRTVNKTLSAASFLNDLKLLVEDGFSLSDLSREETRKHKVAEITTLMTNLPVWQFYLIGDSGEKDPEAYGEIRSKFSKLVVCNLESGTSIC
jgi:phosphatidate phosphatase APP1